MNYTLSEFVDLYFITRNLYPSKRGRYKFFSSIITINTRLYFTSRNLSSKYRFENDSIPNISKIYRRKRNKRGKLAKPRAISGHVVSVKRAQWRNRKVIVRWEWTRLLIGRTRCGPTPGHRIIVYTRARAAIEWPYALTRGTRVCARAWASIHLPNTTRARWGDDAATTPRGRCATTTRRNSVVHVAWQTACPRTHVFLGTLSAMVDTRTPCKPGRRRPNRNN